MGHFVFQLFDPHANTYHMFTGEFDDVENVVNAAKRLSCDYSVEVWSGGARVVRLRKGCASPYRITPPLENKADHANNAAIPKTQSNRTDGSGLLF